MDKIDNKKNKTNKGFSLFEMLVVISIAAMVTAVTFSGFPKMNSKLGLDLLAQDIALSVRQAQVYGTTVFGVEEGGVAPFSAYGISFPTPDFTDSAGKYSYTLFADVSARSDVPFEDLKFGRYNEDDKICMEDGPNSCIAADRACGSPRKSGNAEYECVQSFAVTGKDQVFAICLDYMSDKTTGIINGEIWDKNKRVKECLRIYPDTYNDMSTIMSKPRPNSTIDIVYRRPKLQATILARTTEQPVYANNVGIVLRSESADTRVVVVWKNGQIQVDR